MLSVVELLPTPIFIELLNFYTKLKTDLRKTTVPVLAYPERNNDGYNLLVVADVNKFIYYR